MENIARKGPPKGPSAQESYFDEISRRSMQVLAVDQLIGRETIAAQYALARHRAAFLGEMFRTAPDVIADLYQPENLEAMQEYADAIGHWVVESGVVERRFPLRNGELDYPSYKGLQAQYLRVRPIIEDWQARYNLAERWVFEAAYDSLRLLANAGYPNDVDFILRPAPVDWMPSSDDPERWFPDGMPLFLSDADSNVFPDSVLVHHTVGISLPQISPFPVLGNRLVNLDELATRHYVDDSGREWGGKGNFGTFNPRRETVTQAMERLLPELESRLRDALHTIAAEDMKRNQAMKPAPYRSHKRFEWLVRYQVLNESRSAIAKADRADRANVSRAVNTAAELIGLTPRKERGGRPRKARSNTKRVR